MSRLALHLPGIAVAPAVATRRRAPIIDALASAGLPAPDAERVAADVMRTWFAYLPEPLRTVACARLSGRLRRAVLRRPIEVRDRFAPPVQFFEAFAQSSGLRPARAKVLAQAVLGEWARQAPAEALAAVAAYMPARFRAAVPGAAGLAREAPRSPLLPGPPLPLCTGPTAEGRGWRKREATFERLPHHWTASEAAR